jgi:hypothetical protein
MQLKCNSCGAVQSLSETTKCSYCSNEIVIEKAKEFYETSISSESGSFILIAETALEGENYKEAIDYYNKSIEKVFNNSDAWLGKGIAILYSSTLGDIKTTEAISYWKNAIKFATDQNAMQSRVSTIINNAILTFYPNIENHYREFKDVNNAYTEFVNKFLLLENALSFAISIDDDNLIVLENGYDLCQKVINAFGKYNKSLASSRFDKETNEALNKLNKSIENRTVPKELYEIEKKYVDALNKLDPSKNLISQKEIKERPKVKVDTEKLKNIINEFPNEFYTFEEITNQGKLALSTTGLNTYQNHFGINFDNCLFATKWHHQGTAALFFENGIKAFHLKGILSGYQLLELNYNDLFEVINNKGYDSGKIPYWFKFAKGMSINPLGEKAEIYDFILGGKDKMGRDDSLFMKKVAVKGFFKSHDYSPAIEYFCSCFTMTNND